MIIAILLFCTSVSYFSRAFLCDCKSSQTMFHCLYLSFYFFFFVFWYYLLKNSFGKFWQYWKSPGPRKSSPIISCLLLNFNGLAANDFMKMPYIEAFIGTQNFNIVRLSKTLLDWTKDFKNKNINISGCSILSAYHLCNSKHGGVCISFKKSLAFTLNQKVITLVQSRTHSDRHFSE